MFGLNPYALLGGVLFFIASVTGAFFYGEHVDNVETKAAQLDTTVKALKDYQAGVNGMVDAAAGRAFADFDARQAALQASQQMLAHQLEVQRANANALAASLHGRFALSPAERLQLECLRRPDDTRCTGAAVRTTVPGQVAGPPGAK